VSSPEAANAAAFEELETLVRSLGEELARFRKRALHAESKLKQAQAGGTGGDLFSGDRIAALEAENQDLRARVDGAASRTRAVLERVRFLRQQAAQGNGE